MEYWWNDIDWKTEVLGEKPVCVNLPTTCLTWTGLVSNLGLCGEWLATQSLSQFKG
jgi:hypothetical protein